MEDGMGMIDTLHPPRVSRLRWGHQTSIHPADVAEGIVVNNENVSELEGGGGCPAL